MTDNIIPFDPSIKTTPSTKDDNGIDAMCEYTYNQASEMRARIFRLLEQITAIDKAIAHIETDIEREHITPAEVDSHMADLVMVGELVRSLERAMVE